jgi:hypothetical protein
VIVIFVDEGGVQQVRFQGEGGPLDDPAVYLWPTVRQELFRLDDAVKKASARLAAKLTGGSPA